MYILDLIEEHVVSFGQTIPFRLIEEAGTSFQAATWHFGSDRIHFH